MLCSFALLSSFILTGGESWNPGIIVAIAVVVVAVAVAVPVAAVMFINLVRWIKRQQYGK